MNLINSKNIKNQKGSMLLEGLIGILIFSLGVLSLVGLQSVAVSNVTQAKYRSDAAYLADKLIAQMWIDSQANLVTNYSSSAGGPQYILWRNNIVTNKLLPGVTNTPVNNLPTVNVVNNSTTNSVTATVTLFWQLPSETTSHRYVVVAQIGK